MNSQALEPEVESASSTTTQRRASVIPFRSEEHGRFGVEAFAVAILIFSVSKKGLVDSALCEAFRNWAFESLAGLFR